ncbi:MAG: phosphatase PAP2 family protein [Ignavibacteriales bacterium]|nr:MAG: phosphatase PAP2 family protein [Ignavibacteriales bacterium]
MNFIKSSIKNLLPVDFIVIVFCVFLSLLNLIFLQKVALWHIHIMLNISIISFILITVQQELKKESFVWKQLHFWYLVPLIFIFFKELYGMIDPIRGIIYDDVLILIDRLIFRADPTIALYQIANPILTELLQIVYGTFFFLPVILGIDLIRQKKSEEFNYSAFIIVYGFVLSFIGYILVPAIGPRFTLHNFEMNNIELPGLFITDILREIVNSGESIPRGTINPAMFVQRDAFPSGHTQMTLLVMFLSVKFGSKLKWFFIIIGSLLIFATVYLRYHYVVDLIGGLFFMIFTLWSGKYIYNWFIGTKENIS